MSARASARRQAASLHGRWDAVEQPSQFMEYWVREAHTLGAMARHWQTGAPMPAPLVEKIRAAKTYRAASAMVRQLTFAMTDLSLHSAGFEPAAAAAPEISPPRERLYHIKEFGERRRRAAVQPAPRRCFGK